MLSATAGFRHLFWYSILVLLSIKLVQGIHAFGVEHTSPFNTRASQRSGNLLHCVRDAIFFKTRSKNDS